MVLPPVVASLTVAVITIVVLVAAGFGVATTFVATGHWVSVPVGALTVMV